MADSKHDVFVSFSFKDQAVVERIVKILHNEYNVSCWICTDDLKAGEHFKGAIVDAISAAKLVLLIQSKSSVASKEVPKEVALALEKNKPVIPFLIESADLTGDLEYDLIGIQQIDATKPTLEERVEELACQIYAVLNKKAEDEKSAWQERIRHTSLLSTPSVIPKKIFCGRDEILSSIRDAYKQGERVQFLYGIGGIGKSQIAKQYAKRYQGDYDVIVFATFHTSIEELFVGDAPFVLRPEMARYISADGSQESDADFFKRKLDKIKSISDERTLIIIDNFDVEVDENLSELIDGKYHLLITTRCDYSRFYPTVSVGAIESDEHLIELFMLNYHGYDVEEDDPELLELIEMVNRHTYTVELLAQHMENSGQTPSEMIDALRKEGIRSLCEEVQSEDMRKHAAYENLLKMFHLFSLDDTEKKVLLYLSFMPLEGINAREFRKWAKLDSSKVIKDLENKSWIVKNTEGIALHPIIREVVKCEIPADAENCRDFIDAFTETIDDKKMWQAKREEKNRYASVAKEIIDRFPVITKETEDFYYYAQTLFSFYVDAEAAVLLSKQLYEYHLETYGENDFKTARAAFKRGWTYTFHNHLKNALVEGTKWLQRADVLFEKIEMDNSDDLSRHTMTKTNLSKLNLLMYIKTRDEKNFDLAIRYAENARQHAMENYKPGDFHFAKIAGACTQLAEALFEGGRLEEALISTDEAIDILYRVFGDERHVDMSFVYYIKAEILYAQGSVEEAMEFAEKSAEIYEAYFGETHPRLYRLYCFLGDGYALGNNVAEARRMYERALDVAQKIFSPFSEEVAKAKLLLDKTV